jgi:molybdopterin converting factor small subunit
MAEVWIPALLRGFCGGEDRASAAGRTLGEVIDDLERLCPGIGSRLVVGEALAEGIAVAVDGEISERGLSQSIDADSEIVFLPAIEGGEGGEGSRR